MRVSAHSRLTAIEDVLNVIDTDLWKVLNGKFTLSLAPEAS